MSNTGNSKATFGRKASLSFGDEVSPKTQMVVCQNGIYIRVSRESTKKSCGHIRVDFESMKRKDCYKKLNKMLEEG